MLRIAVAGARGRMGSRIAALTVEHEGLELSAAFERQGHDDIGHDVGELLGLGSLGVYLASSVREVVGSSDVIIDFTQPQATLENMKAAADKGLAVVTGTTGFTKEELEELRSLAGKMPCVFASNMSLGVNLLLKVLADVSRALGDDYDIEIVEAHHRLKKDAPSGTALTMARTIAEAVGRDLDEVGVYARHGMIGQRAAKEIGIQSIRAGDIVGEHTVIFGGLGERVEIAHRVSNRDTFARGALRAALWVADKKPGLYDMQDVLGLK